jgi:predicted amidohydrolase YtcJ
MINRIVYNARFYTQNPSQPWASALAIMGEQIVAIGSDDDIRRLASVNTLLDNAAGRLVIPGLIDAHLHLSGVARALQTVDLMDVSSKAEAAQRVAKRTVGVPAGEWILGRGWRKDSWQGEAFPAATDLDPATPHHPVFLRDRSGHAAWVNSIALQLAGVSVHTPDPAGGQYVRYPDGSPTGLLLEEAIADFTKRVPQLTEVALEREADWLVDAQDLALKAGLTSVHDFDGPTGMAALQLLRERGQHRLRVVMQINTPWIEHAYELGIRSGFGDDWLRIGGLKIFADGALGPQTALMIAPYENDANNYGIAVTDKEEMYALVSKASAHGLLSTIHAIGDKAVHDVLDVFEAVRSEEAQRGAKRTALRHRIEHVQVIHPDDVTRLAELDVIASMQPIHATSDYEIADRYWGQRAAYSYAWRKQLNAGAMLAFGSDAPVESLNPLTGIYAAVARRRADGTPGPEGWYPAERLTREEARFTMYMQVVDAISTAGNAASKSPAFRWCLSRFWRLACC